MVHFQLNSFKALSFLQSVFNALSRGSLIRIGPIRIIRTSWIAWKFFNESFQVFWTGPITLVSFRMRGCFTRSVFCCRCWKCCAAAIDKKFLSLRRLELRTLCVWGTHDNHYTMVTLWKLNRLISVRWLCNMFVVDVQAVSSNSLLATTQESIVYTSLDYQIGLVKGSRFHVRIGILSFWFFFLVLRFQFSLLEFAC